MMHITTDKFKSWGVKARSFPEYKYKVLWHNLKTIQIGEEKSNNLPIEYSEFLDVAINNKCNALCDFCYVSATNKGENYEHICETWKKWMNNYRECNINGITLTEKVLQIAIGSTGEATIHPEFCDFLKTVYETGVVPNYTTNGIILSAYNDPTNPNYELANKILEATNKYCGSVAVSYGNISIRNQANLAIIGLMEKGNVKINIHHLISDKKSVDEFIKWQLFWGNEVSCHTLLPLMPNGRSNKGIEEGVFQYLEDMILKNHIKNVSFGAHFIKDLKHSKIKTWLFDEYSISANCILKPNNIILTKSSFDLKPVKVINLC